MFGIETTGASNDIERATDLARKMVMQYGMSDRIGLMALTTKGNEYLDGQSSTDCAQTTAAAADEEVRKLLNDSYDQAKKILTENRGLLDEVALYLLQKETITGDELDAYVDADKRLRVEAGDPAGSGGVSHGSGFHQEILCIPDAAEARPGHPHRRDRASARQAAAEAV